VGTQRHFQQYLSCKVSVIFIGIEDSVKPTDLLSGTFGTGNNTTDS